MREIKFRGKSLGNGEWVYGDLHIRTPFPHIHSEIDYSRVKIDPHTVGQFTGLHDKNGKEIYEGFGWDAPKMRIKGVCTKYGTVNVEHEAYFDVGGLIEMLPSIIDEYSSYVVSGGGTWSVHYKRIFESRYDTSAKELIDALYKMIVKLKEEGVI